MARAGEGRHTGGMKPTVYVVDDEPDFLTILHTWLSPAFEVVALKDGDELIGALHVRTPDLVLLDLHLPGTDGFELCSRMRAMKGMAKTPILFLTASHENRDYARNIEVGGSGFLTKPIGRRSLLAAIADVLRPPRLTTVDSGGGD